MGWLYNWLKCHLKQLITSIFLRGQYTVYEAIEVFIYVQIYVMDYYVMNTEIAKSNMYVWSVQNQNLTTALRWTNLL